MPFEVRDRLLQLCAAALSPGGVAYVSYNALPGSHLRRYVWDFLKFRTRRAESPRVRIEQAHEMARLIAARPADDPGRAAIRKEMENLLERGDEAIFHDDLAEPNDPFYLMDFIGHAVRHGLQYLGDAEPVRDDVRDLPWPVEDWFEARQYGDFLACRKFRESILCRKDIRLDRSLSLDRFLALAAASRVQPVEPQPATPTTMRTASPPMTVLMVDDRVIPGSPTFGAGTCVSSESTANSRRSCSSL